MILFDTSGLVAAFNHRDFNHIRARNVLLEIAQQREAVIVPSPVIVETFYMISVRNGYAQSINAYNIVRSNYPLVNLTDLDLDRMYQIMWQYRDNEFDYADTAIMALSERLNITRIFTFDRRDFSSYRPAHRAAYALVP
jgi:hypothetical protein